MPTDAHKQRARGRDLRHTLVTALSITFYLALVPVVVAFSGPVYEALRCTLGTCEAPGVEVRFLTEARGPLRVGSAIRLPSGDAVGEVTGFRRGADERYTTVVGVITRPEDAEVLLGAPMRCEISPNFRIETDADLVVSNCPEVPIGDLVLPEGSDAHGVCGSLDHFERVGQELRRLVLDNVRPGHEVDGRELTGPCGADNERATAALLERLGRGGP